MRTFRLSALSFFLLSLLSACSLQPHSDHASLKIVIQPPENQPYMLSHEAMLSPDFTMGLFSAPTATSGFDCLGVNVMGPNIADRENGTVPGAKISALLSGSSFCSYAGITTPPISNSGTNKTLSLFVPTGPSRIVQMVGILQGNTSICSSSAPIGTPSSSINNNDEYYEIGRSVVDLFSDREVNISNPYNTLTSAQQSARRLNCGETSLPISIARESSAACETSPFTSAPAPSTSYGTAISGTDYLTQNSVYSALTCATTGKSAQIFGFSASAVTVTAASKIRVKWNGISGAYTSSCGSGASSGGGNVWIWNGSTWIQVGITTSSLSVETLSTDISTNISSYINNGIIYIAVTGDTFPGASTCSVVKTDSISVSVSTN